MSNNNETNIQNPFNADEKPKPKATQKQPNYAELVEVDNQPNYAELVEVKKGVGGHVADFSKTIASGIASVPDIAIGIGDLYTGGRVGKAIEDSGFYTPGSGSDYWRDKKTINSKAQEQQFSAADGIIEKTKVALSNSSLISNAIGESLAPMVAGGLVGRGLNLASKGRIGAAAAGAIGEGAVMAGSQAESIRQQTDDGLLNSEQVALAGATGVAGSVFGYLGGRIAQKLGFADADTMMANGVRREVAQEAAKDIPFSSIPKSILAGAVTEGVLEELPQSVAEQALQNIALGKPWQENLDDAIVMGTLAGMAMGGGINAYTSSKKYFGQNSNEDQENLQENTNTNLPILPSGGNALDGEFIPADRGQATTGEQGRTNFEYDQFSTEAENLLNQNNGFNPTQDNAPDQPDSPIAPTNPPLSRQLGIHPEEGPLSSAAAIAVDSGASSITTPSDTTQVDDSLLAETNNSVQPEQSAYGSQTAQDIQHGMNEIAQGAKEAAFENTLQRLEKDGEVQLFKTDSIAKAVEDQNYNVRMNDDGSASIIGLRNPSTNEWHGISSEPQSEVQPQAQPESKANVEESSNKVPSSFPDLTQNQNDQQQRLSELNQKFDSVKSVAEKNKIRKEINEITAQQEQAESVPKLEQKNPIDESTAKPILGADGKNKWFASEDKAQAFIDKKNLGNDYQIVQDNKRFEIQAKVNNTQGQNESAISKMASQLSSTANKVNIQPDKQLSDLQSPSQNENNSQPSKTEQKIHEVLSIHAKHENGNKIQDLATILSNDIKKNGHEYFTLGWNKDAQATAEASDYVETILDSALTNLDIKGFDDAESFSNLSKSVLESIDDLYAKDDDSDLDDRPIKGSDDKYHPPKMVKITDSLGRTRYVLEHELNDPNVEFLRHFNENGRRGLLKLQRNTISQDVPQQKQSATQNTKNTAQQETVHPVDQWKADMKEALAKADSQHPLFKKLQLGAKHGLKSTSDRATALRQAREIEKKESNSTQPNDDGFTQVDTVHGESLSVRTADLNDSNLSNIQSYSSDGKKRLNKISRDSIASNDSVATGKEESPKVESEQPKVKESTNTIFTEDAAEKARALLRKKLTQLNAGIDPEILQAGITLAGYHIEKGARSFGAYAKAMTEDLGDMIKPYLKSWYMGVKYDPRASGFDGMSSAVEVEAFDVNDALTNEGIITGKTETVVSPSGLEFDVKHKIVEADDLVVSNLDNSTPNPNYPQQLQPRDRTTAKSKDWVIETSTTLQPIKLGSSATTGTGAPIVSNANEVESGNGRTMAIRRAYQIGKANEYKAWLAQQGYNVANMKQPILVRERITPLTMAERTTYTKESNDPDVLGMNPSERAFSDIPMVMDSLHLIQSGNFNNSANREFVKSVLNSLSKNERGTMLDTDGVSLSQNGYRRIEAALLAAAFNDRQIISEVIESRDSDIKAIGTALIEVAPQWAQVRQAVAEGILVDGVNVEANLVEAVHLVRKSRQQNLTLSEILEQDDMFDGEIDQTTKDFVSIFYSGDKLTKARSSQKVATALRAYANLAMTAKATPNLFGDAPLTNKQILGKVHEQLQQNEAEKQQDIFSSEGTNDANIGESSKTGQGPSSSQSNAGTSESTEGLNNNEQTTSGTSDKQGTQAVRGRGDSTQHNDSQENHSNVETGLSRTNSNTESNAVGQSRIRNTGTNVENNGRSTGIGDESNGRKGTSGTTALPTEQPTRLESPAAVKNTAKDFHMSDPDFIFGGSQKQRFNKNQAALELLEELNNEGRQATAEEQEVLASYTGWGSFGQDLFQGTWDNPIFKQEWKNENLWLRENLGKDAWVSAHSSIVSAFFTDPYTVQAMWSMAEKMGFSGGRVLEPAIGTGNFVSLMPYHLKQRSQVTGIDLDITTASIAKQLFPESNVQNMPYQKSKTPDNFYDLVISNVPFSNDVKIADRRYNQFNPNLHDYYFLKMLDQVRPGGIVMAITSSGTMDKQSEVIRRELAKRAELITSVRLPSGAFKEFAGTAVVTDIIVLRKRAQPLAITPKENWIELSEIKTLTKSVKVNSFYAENLNNVLGTIDYKGGDPRFAGMTVHSNGESWLKGKLKNLSDLVEENTLLPRHNDDHLTYYANKAGERTNTLTIDANGELMFVYGDQMVKATDISKFEIKSAKDTAKRKKSIEDLVSIRKAYTDLTDAERISADNVESLRKKLNKLYEAYVKENGSLSQSFGLKYFEKVEDAYYYSLAALETNGKPTEILKRSVVRGTSVLKNPTISDAFILERNKTAAPTLANIAKIANVSEDQARTELLEKSAIYVMPNGDVIPTDMYLSGNVRLKLEEAQNAVAEGNVDLQRNIDALKEVIPEDIPYFNIEAKVGATWVPLSDYENYIAHMLGMTDTNGITVTFPNGKWKVKLENNASRRTEATTNYGSKHKSFQTVVSAALSNQNITVKYKNADGSESVDVEATEEVNGKISKIKEEFATWLWSNPERRIQLEKEYNHSFNAWATPKYDGSFMSMQGMALDLGNGPFSLRQHQQNAIWRAIVNRRSINAHEVGTGKTFTMGGIALESRRYGIAKKPLILAHNANSAAVAKEIQMMYPSARILFISELGKAVRQIRMRQIANDDWDLVVMPHSMIEKLTLSEETLMAMAADDIAALESELADALEEEGGATIEEVLAMDSETINKKMGFKNPTAKQLAKQRLKLLEDIQKQAMDSSKDDAVNFEELGIDMIMVDEVHEFKKPSIATRMNMKGLNTNSNKRSTNLQLLTRYVRRMNNGGNVHTFTGTPITNTLTEIYHQMRYVMEEEMQKLNVAVWDGWFGSFATEITDIELSATGDYQLVTRLAGFVNVPELRKMIGQFMDIVFANDMPEMQPRKTKSGKVLSDESLTEAEKAELLNGRTEGAKDRPYKKVINITTEMSPTQEAKLKDIQGLAKQWESATGKQKRQWLKDGDPRSPLSISTAAKKASYDPRIDDPNFVGKEGISNDYETSKASQVVKNVMEIYNSHPLASQVIFADTGYKASADRSTGKKDDNGKTIRHTVKVFSPIKDIVERLVQQGIPRDQIAIVDGSVKAEARKAIADKVNSGEIRVVIGLTQTLGVGVNMQKNLRAMHHLDAPWMPGELEQRNGRGLRQANQWNTVLEYRYITDKLDGKSWQVLAIKDRFINAFMKADGNVRTIEGDAAEDNAEDNAGDIMSSFSEASGDPRVLQRIKMKEKLEKLRRKERLHTQGIADMKRTIGNAQRYKARLQQKLDDLNDNNILAKIEELLKSQAEKFNVQVDGKTFDKHKEASEAIEKFIVDNIRLGTQSVKFAKYAGTTMTVQWGEHDQQATLSIKIGNVEYHANTLRGLEGQLRGAPRELEKLNNAITKEQDTINSLSKASEQSFGQAEQLQRTEKQLASIEQDLEQNPVAPPIWLRRGAPIDTEVHYKGKLFIVAGHRYTDDGWFVSAEDVKGTIEIPYMEATDSVGMPIYEEHTFEKPNIEDKTVRDEKPKGTEEAQTDTPLYSRKSGSQKAGQTVSQVRDALIKRFGKATIEALEKQGKLHIIQSHHVEGAEGFYHDGRATLIADNLTATSIVPTFLHELGGHLGFQNILTPKQYAELMKQFDKLVSQGNRIALEAKKLAEREMDSQTQLDEMLPYLITLAATIQETSVSQKGAFAQFISKVVSAVKAWAFDKLGVSLNLSPNDILELANRMVNRAANQVKSNDLNNGNSALLSQDQNSRIDMHFKDVVKRTPELQEAAKKVKEGEMTHDEYAKIVNQVKPVAAYKFIPEPATFAEMENALHANKVEKLGIPSQTLENGHPVGLRLDIPAYSDHGVWVVTVHEQKSGFQAGSPIGYESVAIANQLDFGVVEKAAINIASGKPKATIATMKGAWENTTPEQAKIEAQSALNDPSWIQVGMDPERHAYFYDRETMQPVVSAERLIQIGPLVLAKNPIYGDTTEYLFSRRTDDMSKILSSITSNMNKQGAKNLKEKAAFKFGDALQYLLQGLGRRQITDIYTKILPHLAKYNTLAAQLDADKNEAGAKADEIVVRWAKVKDEDQLAEIMHEATLAKIDPDKNYVSGDNKVKYDQLRADFNALSPDAQQMYRDARDAYKKHHSDVLKAIKERIMRASIDSQKKAKLMRDMDNNFFHSLKGVYFPLSRFGKYVVIVRKRNGDVESVNRAETMGEADALRKELIKKFPNSNVEKVSRDKEFNSSRDMVGRGFMSELFDELDKFGLSTSKQAELEDILGQLYLSSLPDLSWAKHGIHRKGTAGFSQDARRAFAQNMFHGAGYLAKLRYADTMATQLEEMQKYADNRKNNADYNQPVAQAVIDEMNKRHESLMAPDSSPLSSALTSLGFVYFLGLSVASGAVNLLQTVLVAYPQMGAKWGFDNAFRELFLAGGQSAKGLNDISKLLTGDELAAYNEAVRRGVIDVTQAHDLAGIAQGEDSGVMWKLRPIMRWASFFFHHAERFNREVTFVAAYRLAKQAGTKPDEAFRQAMKATYDGHFDYSAGNRPRIMQGNVAKVVLLFKQFGQNMLYTMIRSLHQSFKGETPQAKREARRALTGILASHTVFAGTLGLPLVSMLLGLLSFFGGGDDDPWDAETALKNNLSDMIGVTSADVLMHGISRATPWDISGRVGINNLIVPQTRDGLEGEGAAQAYLTAGLGPIAGIVVNILKGFSEISDGHGMRGIETMVPTFLRGPMRALRFADEGAQDKTGVSIKDDVGAAAIFGQALGFAPSEVRLATEGRSAVYKMQKRLDERRSSLLNKFARAKMQNDDEQMTEVWNEIQEFNQANPSRRINKIQAMQGYRSRQKRIDHAENGMVVSRKKRDDMDEGRFAFAD